MTPSEREKSFVYKLIKGAAVANSAIIATFIAGPIGGFIAPIITTAILEWEPED
jgi:hypothetical protein